MLKSSQCTSRHIGMCLGIVVVLFLAVVSAYCCWVMCAHGVALEKYERLRPGMTRGQVRILLGKPSTVYAGDNKRPEEWIYDRFTWCMMKVYFSTDGTVDGFDHDH